MGVPARNKVADLGALTAAASAWRNAENFDGAIVYATADAGGSTVTLEGSPDGGTTVVTIDSVTLGASASGIIRVAFPLPENVRVNSSGNTTETFLELCKQP